MATRPSPFWLGCVLAAVGCATGGVIPEGVGGDGGATTQPTGTTSTTTTRPPGTTTTSSTTTTSTKTSSGSTTSTSGTTSTTSTTTTTTTTSTTSTTTSTTSTTPTGCTHITAASFQVATADGQVGVYVAAANPNIGGAEADRLGLELYGSGVDPSYNGEATGTFNLAAGADANYATCSRCVRLVEDPTTPGRVFFQAAGSVTIAAGSSAMNGTIDATLTNVKLVEVLVDPLTYVSTPVPGGACILLPTATISVASGVPGAWTCNPDFYGDGLCDCGCGAPDADCAGSSVLACDFCNDDGSCSTVSCPGSIDPLDNATCGASSVPAGWVCNPGYYDDGLCDCGCGAFDANDCADTSVLACDFCSDVGSCSASSCPGTIDATNNAVCAP